jgi:hypothetical protein
MNTRILNFKKRKRLMNDKNTAARYEIDKAAVVGESLNGSLERRLWRTCYKL